MSQKKILGVFVAVVVVALILRTVVFDIVVISNFDLFPKFQTGETVLVSRVSSPKSQTWVLVKNFPSQGNYSVRRLGKEIEPGKWTLERSENSGEIAETSIISREEILGRVVMTLWAFPCRNTSELCSQTSYKILTFTN